MQGKNARCTGRMKTVPLETRGIRRQDSATGGKPRGCWSPSTQGNGNGEPCDNKYSYSNNKNSRVIPAATPPSRTICSSRQYRVDKAGMVLKSNQAVKGSEVRLALVSKSAKWGTSSSSSQGWAEGY